MKSVLRPGLVETGGAMVSSDKGGTFGQGEHSLPTGAGLP